MLWLLAFITVGVSLSVLAGRVSGTRVDPVSLYFGVWGVLLLLVVVLPLGYDKLVETTWREVAVASAAFTGGCFAAWEFTARARREAIPEAAVDYERLRRAHKWLLVVLAGYTLIQMARLLPTLQASGGLSALFGGNGIEFRRAQLEASAAGGSTSLVVGLASYALLIGSITLFWGGYLARRGDWLLALLPLVMAAVFSLFALQRFTFVYSLLIFAFSYSYFRDAVPTMERVDAKRPLTILAALTLIVIFVPLLARDPGVPFGQRLLSTLDYFTGGIAGFNDLQVLNIPGPDPQPGHGLWTLRGVFDVLNSLGASITLPPTDLPFLDIAQGRDFFSNVYTWLIYPIYDFGVAGLVAVPAILGVASAWLHRQVVRRRFEYVPAAAIAMTTVAMSFFGLSLIREFRWLFIAVVGVPLGRAVMTRPGKAPRRKKSFVGVGVAPRDTVQ